MKKPVVLSLALASLLSGCGDAAPTAPPPSFVPEQEIRWVCTSSPGGGSDLFSRTLIDVLQQQNLLSDAAGGSAEFYVSDSTEQFAGLAQMFLGQYAGGSVQQIAIEEY